MTDLEQMVLALNNTQVYFSIEVCNTDFRTIAKANHVYYVDTAKIEDIRPGVYFFQMYGPDITINLYEYLTYDEMSDFVLRHFIPLEYLVKAYERGRSLELLT